ncbi:protein-L-isoaspartate(D-aspartate) O-methyltransferase [Litorimonas taeanensis]|uniref:Protein-L-isoaspartate O-methyltransferase n=1 Tax=Litorimonas taeanensis TaxID=568099 RepID=A0A420WKH6_9PROT|nr:protein-L-isoaspartate(D-aspartate) O-methyltransferase [Litorimonas taeanensis]RKQ71500.1 protein-L-isoaspartate(D-aspartate) O-methyltransferase [Litorimonas taeanensis]
MAFDPGLIDMVMRLRGKGISDNKVLRAIELAPRKAFVPAEYFDKAYAEQSLPIDCGQTITAPWIVSLMLQFLRVEKGHKVLEIGVGSGYQTAVLSHLCKRVYAVERYKKLIADAEGRLSNLQVMNTVIRHGDGRYGWAGQAPFHRIIMGCASRAAPPMLLEQLATGGEMIAVVDEQLMRYSKARSKVSEETLMPLNLDMIEPGKSRSL